LADPESKRGCVQPYDDDYYLYFKDIVPNSAKVIVPIVLELVQAKSVVDVGCGTGEWLSVFKEHGVEDICGIDGKWVNEKLLAIPAEDFIPLDLRQPIDTNRRFDLVVSLEVAEHLPEQSAVTFVDSLTKLGPVVLFSAAVPNQGGDGHLNEQWQDYWARLFDDKGYATIDCVRNRVWTNEDVLWWYAQNTVLYVAQERLEREPLLQKEYELHSSAPLSLVHPSLSPVPSWTVDFKLQRQKKRLKKRLTQKTKKHLKKERTRLRKKLARVTKKHHKDRERLLQELAVAQHNKNRKRLFSGSKRRHANTEEERTKH
jgi:SAM-dependent methyltransferase